MGDGTCALWVTYEWLLSQDGHSTLVAHVEEVFDPGVVAAALIFSTGTFCSQTYLVIPDVREHRKWYTHVAQVIDRIFPLFQQLTFFRTSASFLLALVLMPGRLMQEMHLIISQIWPYVVSSCFFQ